MVKTNIILFILLCFKFSVVGQDNGFIPVENVEGEYQNLLKASKQIKSISCSFVQYKELSVLSETIVSEGSFYLLDNDKLLWEYKTPYFYKIVINGDKMEIDNSNSKVTFDTRSNGIFRELSNIMIRSVDGSIITDKATFDPSLFESKSELKAILNPKTKELDALFEEIILYFNKRNYLVNKIEMLEKLGDTTTIVLKNQKLNEDIESKIFNISN
jgi:outer membrane lipoprotein-sorting protein